MKRAALIALVILVFSLPANALTVRLSSDGSTPAPPLMDVNPSDWLTLYGIADTGGLYWLILEMDTDAPAIISNIQAGPGGPIIQVDIFPLPSLGGEIIVDADSGGIHFSFDLDIDSDATIGDYFDLWITKPNDGTYPIEDSINFNVVPEPVTILLLGLGVMALRKRY